MDATDQMFFPCSCGYQVCMFCYNRLLESDPRCPGCRSKYQKKSDEMFRKNVDSSSMQNNNNNNNGNSKKNGSNKNNKNSNDNSNSNNKKSKNKRDNNDSNDNNGDNGHGSHGPSHIHLSFDQMAEIRVRQKNLVYVVGLPVKELDETALKSNKWFGRFGKIKKVYCNKKTTHAVRTGSFAAFITYFNQKDALSAIQAMNGKPIDDHRILRATTGSTKYCSYFLRGQNCTNPQCLYLHDWARDEDVVTKEELNDFVRCYFFDYPCTKTKNCSPIPSFFFLLCFHFLFCFFRSGLLFDLNFCFFAFFLVFEGTCHSTFTSIANITCNNINSNSFKNQK